MARKTRFERKDEIVEILVWQTMGMKSAELAKRVGLENARHFKAMLKELENEGKIYSISYGWDEKGHHKTYHIDTTYGFFRLKEQIRRERNKHVDLTDIPF